MSKFEEWDPVDREWVIRKADPRLTTEIERHPDKRASSSRIAYSHPEKKDIQVVLEVRGLGALILRSSTGHPDGRLRCEGISTFTQDEIKFDSPKNG